MVCDKIENAKIYFSLSDRIKTALEYLQQTDFMQLETGKYEIDGDKIFALVQSYKTKPFSEGKWEAHRKYIDIQFIAEGIEQIGCVNLKELEEIKSYNAENDFALYKGSGDFITAATGTFVIFFPEDSHMPGIKSNVANDVKKIVVKVAV